VSATRMAAMHGCGRVHKRSKSQADKVAPCAHQYAYKKHALGGQLHTLDRSLVPQGALSALWRIAWSGSATGWACVMPHDPCGCAPWPALL